MSQDEDRSSKTEEPTPRKIERARREGDVPVSREAGTAMSVLALLVVVAAALPAALPMLMAALMAPIEGAGRVGVFETREAGAAMGGLARAAGLALAPVFGAMALCGLVGAGLQGPVVMALKRLRPKPEKLSPLGGVKRLFGPEALVEFAKSVLKVAVVGALALWGARHAMEQVAGARAIAPEALPGLMQQAVGRILVATALFVVPLAVADAVWKRISWRRKQRMSFKELRDETKDSEGDPHIRARRAEIRRARARQRLAAAVPTASLVLTNPTHYAVALRYDPERGDDAPVCVAKGCDLVAARIREIASANDIPLIENRPLARALHDTVEVDARVPIDHWAAIAEIVGFVMDLRRDIRRAPPQGSRLREDP